VYDPANKGESPVKMPAKLKARTMAIMNRPIWVAPDQARTNHPFPQRQPYINMSLPGWNGHPEDAFGAIATVLCATYSAGKCSLIKVHEVCIPCGCIGVGFITTTSASASAAAWQLVERLPVCQTGPT
jgi:hypothetical protein